MHSTISSDTDDDAGKRAGSVSSFGPSQHVRLETGFLDAKLAENLRGAFDLVFARKNARELNPKRFVWDNWFVENQYHMQRTPASEFFSEDLYAELENALLEYGQRRLGCSSMTPVWLSYYTHGMKQELHADVPHGPFAFVLSLTLNEHRKSHFTGGETVILKPRVLDYWRSFEAHEVIEETSILTRIEPEFNRLVVFDPRFPHGVSQVEGTRDPSKGRLVLHGWFAEPSPFFEGEAFSNTDAAADALNLVLEDLFATLQEMPRLMGVLCLRLTIAANDGRVQHVEILADTLIPHPSDFESDPAEVRDEALNIIFNCLAEAKFAVDKADSEIQDNEECAFVTIPLVFE
ncbi:hypothetical protein FVE85_0485 [Porphyridium purpureum]|uniref:Prolyl 4-hydroxylase alpha subunit Fe(2+) 2OG dioxygenase domain-containing protein n=1 Tax=Porphyridium purpureum TaxID=35688 RepID=A0A5J4YZK8_PORPP|nr:hypothetical protein FVE85_0485 [Porphyridium purpureum]|eukprot:POR6996..scf208_2